MGLEKFYNGKKVFVTGHTGFKGSWLCRLLHRFGADVVGYALKPDSEPSHFELLGLSMKSFFADIREIDVLKKAIEETKPDIVLHLAAQPLVRRSYREPIENFDVNIIGTAKLLEACRGVQTIKAIVVVTTDKCYENREWEYPYRETDTLGGYDPYSASKAAAEIVSASYRSSFFRPAGVGVATVRAGNVIGGGDWSEDRLLPDVIRAALSGQKAPIRSPHSVRPWQHVLEPLYGYLLLAKKLYEGESVDEAWNFGPSGESTLSVLGVLEIARGEWEKVDFEVSKSVDSLHEAKLLRLDSSKAHSRLGWKCAWDAKTSVKMSIEWYRAFYERDELLTDKQIDKFLGAVG